MKQSEEDITRLDYSPNMMEKAKHRAEATGLKNVRFLHGDVGTLPFDARLDAVFSLNGLRVFHDKDAAFAEN